MCPVGEGAKRTRTFSLCGIYIYGNKSQSGTLTSQRPTTGFHLNLLTAARDSLTHAFQRHRSPHSLSCHLADRRTPAGLSVCPPAPAARDRRDSCRLHSG